MNTLLKFQNNINNTIDIIEDTHAELFDLIKDKNYEIKYLKFKNENLKKQILKLKLKLYIENQ